MTDRLDLSINSGLNRAQLIIKCLQHNQISGALSRGCTSNQMALAKTMIGGIGAKENPITIDQRWIIKIKFTHCKLSGEKIF